ncbi:branched-chain amino acid ABC transporter permease [Paraherbaspirillum soli]|uniref:Branched-chain amino acid ABC transporter permease n=1 Tax=Paraherbaspirillum soli TaxID=631222 RepID=A0ABW0MFU5_9BURK
MEFTLITLLNGLSYGLLLFLLSAGLTLIFSMLGVLNFAHASFYMLGAYFAYAISVKLGFWPALVLSPLLVGTLGALVEHFGLRHVHRYGQVPELLFTFGLSYLIVELVQLVWGKSALPYAVPAQLDSALFTLYGTAFPLYRGFMMLLALLILLATYLFLKRSRLGLVVQAALSHPQMVEALGHNVPRIYTLVFAAGCALAGLAGVVGGNAFVTEPGMAAGVGSIIFVVVVVGGLGSLAGAFVASLLIGVAQTYAVALDVSLLSALAHFGIRVDAAASGYPLLQLTVAQVAPILPYLLLIIVMLARPRGLLGVREG